MQLTSSSRLESIWTHGVGDRDRHLDSVRSRGGLFVRINIAIMNFLERVVGAESRFPVIDNTPRSGVLQ